MRRILQFYASRPHLCFLFGGFMLLLAAASSITLLIGSERALGDAASSLHWVVTIIGGAFLILGGLSVFLAIRNSSTAGSRLYRLTHGRGKSRRY